MKIQNFLLGTVLFVSASAASASTILTPTDGNVNFYVNPRVLDAGLFLAIFDDSEAVAGGTRITPSTGLLVNLEDGFLFDAGTIDFLGASGAGGAYQADNQSETFDFPVDPSNDSFIVGLGVPRPGGIVWIADSGFIEQPGGNGGLLLFAGRPVALVVDVVQVVPVPSAVWLFGTGLLGLVGVARRRP